MKNKFAKIVLFTLVAAALVAVPATSRAGDTSDTKTNAPAVAKRLPFRGKAAAVDTNAMTVTVGTLTLNITSETRITKAGKPAVLADITAGETVTGSYKKDEAGKLNVSMIRVDEKAPDMGKKKKAENDVPAAPAAPPSKD